MLRRNQERGRVRHHTWQEGDRADRNQVPAAGGQRVRGKTLWFKLRYIAQGRIQGQASNDAQQ